MKSKPFNKQTLWEANIMRSKHNKKQTLWDANKMRSKPFKKHGHWSIEQKWSWVWSAKHPERKEIIFRSVGQGFMPSYTGNNYDKNKNINNAS